MTNDNVNVSIVFVELLSAQFGLLCVKPHVVLKYAKIRIFILMVAEQKSCIQKQTIGQMTTVKL